MPAKHVYWFGGVNKVTMKVGDIVCGGRGFGVVQGKKWCRTMQYKATFTIY